MVYNGKNISRRGTGLESLYYFMKWFRPDRVFTFNQRQDSGHGRSCQVRIGLTTHLTCATFTGPKHYCYSFTR